jgi:hypothetical protein
LQPDPFLQVTASATIKIPLTLAHPTPRYKFKIKFINAFLTLKWSNLANDIVSSLRLKLTQPPPPCWINLLRVEALVVASDGATGSSV